MRNSQHALMQLLDAFLEPLNAYFSRRRVDQKWSPINTVLGLLIATLQSYSGYESLLSILRCRRPDYFGCGGHESSFCRARKKITVDLLMPCWANMQSTFLRLFGDAIPNMWGYRLVAIDGSTMNGRRSRKLFQQLRKKRRGRPPKDPQGQPQLLVVMLVDVLTRLPIACEYAQVGEGERSIARRLLKHLGPQDILLADRGFPARHIIATLIDSGVRFIFRMQTGVNAFREVRTARYGQRKDRSITIYLDQKNCGKSADLRLVRGHFWKNQPSGKKPEEWFLLTNLPKNARWTRSTILNLYHERWGIETFFRELKNILNVEHFHAQDAEGMKVEIMMAMVAASLMAAAELIAMTITLNRMPNRKDFAEKRCNHRTLATIVYTALTTVPRIIDVSVLLDQELHIVGLRARKRKPGRRYPRICKSFYGKWKHRFKNSTA